MNEIRHFQESDIPSVVDLWNRTFQYDPVFESLIREKTYEDPDYDPALTLVADGENNSLVGFAQGLLRPDFAPGIGWIKLFAVDYAREQSVAHELLKRVEKALASSGVTQIQLFDSAPNYLMPGLDPRYTAALVFFERHAYRRFDDTANLQTELAGCDFDTGEDQRRLASEGIEIRRARSDDRTCVHLFLSRTFPEWIPEVERTFANNPVSLHLAILKGEVVAFSAYDANNIGTGWFGPMGTEPSLRGRGVGTVLYLRCLRDLQQQGYSKAIIPWVGPIAFYYRASRAQLTRVFWRYRKQLF